jgi:hypothetical protein
MERKPKAYMLFAEAWLFLALARMILLVVPFKRIAARLKDKEGKGNGVDEQGLEMIRDAIIRAGSRSPWRTKCFEKALAAKMMLRRRGMASIIYFGVRKDEQLNMHAHAWVKCGERVITGGKGIEQYTLLTAF